MSWKRIIAILICPLLLFFQSRYYFSHAIESAILTYSSIEKNLSLQQCIFASLIGGILSSILTYPLDFLVTKAQDAKNAGKRVTALKSLVKDRGRFWLGIEIRILHVCLTTIVVRTGSDMMYNYLFVKDHAM